MPGGAAFTCTGASGLGGGGLLAVGIIGAPIVKTWPPAEVQAPGAAVKTWPLVETPGTASLLTPGDPRAPAGPPGCITGFLGMRKIHLASGRSLHLLRHIGHLSRKATFMSSTASPCGCCL